MEIEMAASKNQPSVLVVDDESAIRDMIRFALEKADMQVTTASNAHDALLSISDDRPDIILMDWMMPGVRYVKTARVLGSCGALVLLSHNHVRRDEGFFAEVQEVYLAKSRVAQRLRGILEKLETAFQEP